MDTVTNDVSVGEGDQKEASSPLAEIDARLAILKRFETDRHSDDVERAKEVMHTIVDPVFPWFNSKGVVVTYHGSLQYNDPKNLDVDLTFVSNNVGKDDKEFDDHFDKLESAFETSKTWPRARCDAELSVGTVEELKAQSAIFENAPYDPRDKRLDLYLPDYMAALMLSSALLYESQKPKFAEIQSQVRDVVKGSPWLQAGVKHWLDQTIKDRHELRHSGS